MIAAMSDSSSSADDAASIAAARRGESSGFDDIYRRLAGPVTAFARARGATDPEGITNDTFLRAFRSLDRFSGDADALRAWVFSIARNLVIDAHRAQQRRPREVWAPPPEQSSPGADVEALDRIGRSDTMRRFDCLTEEQREVIVLRLVADLTLAETAEIVGRPVTAVKRLQARALRRLQKEILDEEVSS